jgi:aspartate kinase
MVKPIVVKFGGSVLENEDSIAKSASLIKELKEKGFSPVVVISAMKGVTDQLINLSKKVNPNASKELNAQLLSMGERTASRLFTSALVGKGLDAILVDPEFDIWPIYAEGDLLDANPLYEESKRAVKSKLLPLIKKGSIPVVCGFIAKTKDGKIATLGRGGSDTTAVLLGSCLKAKEVVLVKDVETVYSSDPDKVENAKPLHKLDAEEAFILSSSGAKFLHSKALRYKDDNLIIRITSLEQGLKGTIIDGGSLEIKIESLLSKPITMITILRSKHADANISELINEIQKADSRLIAMTMDEKAIVLYVSGGKDVLNKIHKKVVANGLGKAVSSFENLALIRIKGRLLETSPGMIQRVTQPLARHGINILGLNTISSSIQLFLAYEDVENAIKLLKDALMISKVVKSKNEDVESKRW